MDLSHLNWQTGNTQNLLEFKQNHKTLVAQLQSALHLNKNMILDWEILRRFGKIREKNSVKDKTTLTIY